MRNGSIAAGIFGGLDDDIGPNLREKRWSVLLVGSIARAGSRNRMRLTVRNISAHGLMAECAYPPRPGDLVDIELPGIGSVLAYVRWGDGNRIGLEFDGPVDPTLAFARHRLAPVRSGLTTAH